MEKMPGLEKKRENIAEDKRPDFVREVEDNLFARGPGLAPLDEETRALEWELQILKNR